MSLIVASIASGSNGNCYYIGNDSEAVLIDAGIPHREIEKRMQRLQLSLQNVKAIFVSHEHTDHIKGLYGLAGRWNLPVYITDATRQRMLPLSGKYQFHHFKCSATIRIGALEILPFSKAHDAVDPHSFMVAHKGVHVGVFTDIGTICKQCETHFRRCHAVFLESNYDEKMLHEGAYPFFLKNRIRGGRGHLSNAQALAFFQQHKAPYLSHLFLSHLSRNNNCPQLVEQLFTAHAGNVKIVVASRERESEVYHITQTTSTGATHFLPHYIPPVAQLEMPF